MDMAFCFGFTCSIRYVWVWLLWLLVWPGLVWMVWFGIVSIVSFCPVSSRFVFDYSIFLSPGRLSDIVIVWDGGGVLLFLTM
jgi:hypothetical protein